jgi:nucleoside-diphosphate-sugar epimerase
MSALPQRAFVTGATGFIGAHLLGHLHSAGWRVAVLARPGTAETLNGHPAIDKLYLYRNQTQDVLDAVSDFCPTVVFHLASLFLASHSSSQIEPLISSNVLLGARLLEAMKVAGCHHLVNTGTAWQNFHSPTYNPVNLYAATKQAFEDILAFYAASASIRAITLRIYDSYGPGDRRRKLLRVLLESLQSGAPLAMSPGEQIMDLVHVDDICRAFLRAAALVTESSDDSGNRLRPGQSSHRIYAVSGGQRRTLRQVIATMEEAAGRTLAVNFGAQPYREREVMIPWDGPALPGWQPQVDLLSGFRQLLAEEFGEAPLKAAVPPAPAS